MIEWNRIERFDADLQYTVGELLLDVRFVVFDVRCVQCGGWKQCTTATAHSAQRDSAAANVTRLQRQRAPRTPNECLR